MGHIYASLCEANPACCPSPLTPPHARVGRRSTKTRGRQAPVASRPAPSPAIERRHFSTDISTGADSRRGTRPGGAQASGTARRRDGPRAISSGGAATPNETNTAGTRRSGTRRGGRRSPGGAPLSPIPRGAYGGPFSQGFQTWRSSVYMSARYSTHICAASAEVQSSPIDHILPEWMNA